MFLILIPVPYVDASQATALADKRQRMLVGLGGMMAELAVAALALFLWLSASPGMGKAFLHQILVAAGVTTIVFNANPLLRFDGYAPTARGASVLFRQVHGMVAVHNLGRLQDLAGSMAAVLRQ